MWKVVTAIVILLGSFAGGLYIGRGHSGEVITKEIKVKGETIVKTIEKIKWRERIVQPDGTIIEREREEDRDTASHEKETTTNTDSSITSNRSKYSLGLAYSTPLSVQGTIDNLKGNPYRNAEIRAGIRVLGPAWGEASYRLDNSVTLGIRLEF
jgi:hypothetical protein